MSATSWYLRLLLLFVFDLTEHCWPCLIRLGLCNSTFPQECYDLTHPTDVHNQYLVIWEPITLIITFAWTSHRFIFTMLNWFSDSWHTVCTSAYITVYTGSYAASYIQYLSMFKVALRDEKPKLNSISHCLHSLVVSQSKQTFICLFSKSTVRQRCLCGGHHNTA